MLLYKTISAREFVETEEPLKVLTEFNKIHFDDEESKELTKRKQTTQELISCLEDLKVLGKKEFKKILKWRVKMRELEHLDSSSSSEEEEEAPPLTEEEKAEQLNQEISAKLAEQEKLKRKKERKKKRLREKLKKKLGMSLLQDATPYENENPTDTEALFNLKQVKTNQVLQNLTTETAAMEVDEEEEEFDDSESDFDSDEDEEERYNRELESALDGMYKRYLEASRSRRKRMTEEMRKMKDEDEEDMTGLLGEEPLGQYDPEEDEEAKQANPLIVREPQENKSKVWFSNILHNLSGMKGKKLSDILDDEREEDEEVKRMALEYKQEKEAKKSRGTKRKLDEDGEETNGHMESTVGPAAKKLKTGQQTAVAIKPTRVTKVTKGDFSDMPSLEPVGTPFKAISRKAALKERTKSTPKTAETTADDDVNTLSAAQQFEEYYKQQMARNTGVTGKKGKKNEVTFEEVPAVMSGEEDSSMEEDSMDSADSDDKAEVLALGHALKFGGTRRRQELMDATYTGRNFNFGDAAPAWFVEEDNLHNQPNIPITKEEVQMYKDQLKGINARTIKKVLEAQARKKKRESAKVAKAKQQARVIMQSEDISDKDKAKQLQKLFAKSGKGKTKVNNVYVVSKKNGAASLPNRRKGYRVKIVDPRMKKDKRGEANAQRKKGFKVKGATKEQKKAAKKYSRR